MSDIFKKISDYFKFSRSDLYWIERYKKNGNSGAGSYGDLAVFKTNFFNTFIKKEKINSVIDFGCGDGNQMTSFQVAKCIGLDISAEIIEFCKNKFKNDTSKDFLVYDYKNFDNHNLVSDLAVSMDVIYHLVEDSIYNKYMNDLFSCARKFVVVYSTNHDNNPMLKMPHVRHRNFSKWINNNKKEWKFYKKVDNKFPSASKANFYIYKKD